MAFLRKQLRLYLHHIESGNSGPKHYLFARSYCTGHAIEASSSSRAACKAK
jgi:hypothetical protein